MSERDLQTRILKLSRGPVRLFRNNVGTGWQGSKVLVNPGGRSAMILDPRAVKFGLIKGSGDLIGWRSLTITPAMVGQTVAVFASVEVKAKGGRASKEQRQFAAIVQAQGGIAGFARSVDEAKALLGLDTAPDALI